MGAALTYARRYALFTLVGIAGEDDLDAPDLNAKIDLGAGEGATAQARAVAARFCGTVIRCGSSAVRRSSLEPQGAEFASFWTNLGAEQSAALREQLIVDLALLQSEDEAAEWVHKNLPTKNTLTAADAALIETSFRDKLAADRAGVRFPRKSAG